MSNGNKLGIIDRLVRTLRELIDKYFDKDNDDQIARHLNDRMHNQKVYQAGPFYVGDKVRILQKKKKLIKESRN